MQLHAFLHTTHSLYTCTYDHPIITSEHPQWPGNEVTKRIFRFLCGPCNSKASSIRVFIAVAIANYHSSAHKDDGTTFCAASVPGQQGVYSRYIESGSN